jgi:S-adenosylmethionine hydrolase
MSEMDKPSANIKKHSSDSSANRTCRRIITLTTDFGLEDWYVAAMKGAILGVNSEAAIVDICHQIPIGNITAGGFVLDQASKEFPSGSIHGAVVDPGVGGERKPLLAECDGQTFIGPDNGILSRVLERSRAAKVYEITNQQLLTRPLSKTFHGRDLFGPMAALRSLDVQAFDFGVAQLFFCKNEN